MRGSRRRILNLAGAIFLASLLSRIAFLITGLRTYATRPEIPLRIAEMLTLLLAALFTYYFSYRFGFVPMAAGCLLSLYTPVRELISGSRITIGYMNQKLDADGYIFAVLMIVGLLLMAVLSVLTCPLIPRSEKKRRMLHLLSTAAVLIFAASMVYQIVLLALTLIAETYPGEFITKYFYVAAATDFALILTGVACFMTADISPSDRRRKSEDRTEV